MIIISYRYRYIKEIIEKDERMPRSRQLVVRNRRKRLIEFVGALLGNGITVAANFRWPWSGGWMLDISREGGTSVDPAAPLLHPRGDPPVCPPFRHLT
jgi:hypothetical protein